MINKNLWYSTGNSVPWCPKQEGNSKRRGYTCLENPMDGGAW